MKPKNNQLNSSKTRPTPEMRLSVTQHYGWVSWAILVFVLAVSSILSVLFLRLNNQNMAKYRDALVAADKTGDAKQVQRAAKLLQNYVAGHMNTATGKIALQTLYNQAAEKALEASKPVEVSTDVYQAATEACKPELNNRGYRAWASCVADKVGAGGAYSLDANKQSPPDPDIYYIEYSPARWSLDLAGISLLVVCLATVILLIKVVLTVIMSMIRYLKNHTIKIV